MRVIENVGEVIKSIRTEQRLSQESLAYRVGYEQTAISKIERGKQKPSVNKARKLAVELGLEEDALLAP